VPIFGPFQPRLVTAREPAKLEIAVGDDLAAFQRRGLRPSIQLHLEAPAVQKAEQLRVRLNGTELTNGVVTRGWADYSVPPACAKRGVNEVHVAVEPAAFAPSDWSIVYDGSAKPGRLWRRDPGSARIEEELEDGSLRIADRGDVAGDYLYYRYAWGADPQGEAVAEARVKVVSGSSFLIVTNGVGGERLGLWPDRVELFHKPSLRYKMDTTGDFHLYRMELKGADLKVYVDGELRIDAPGAMGTRAGYASSEVAFGAANSGMLGEACWDHVQARATGLVCRDLAVSVTVAAEPARAPHGRVVER
jgi:hypothetical protein